MTKTSISVRDMGRLLGLGKTGSYWLVKKKYFEVRTVAGNMRIMLDSFEDWYAGQFHYKKVTGEQPGTKWTNTTLSVKEVALALGICESTVYEVLKRSPIEVRIIDNRTRIERASFAEWFSKQDRYPIVKKEEEKNV